MLINNIKKNMKKVYKKLIILFIAVILGIILNCSESNAASATISASSQNVSVGDNVTITVNVNGCLSELTVSGPGISGRVDIVSTDLTNQSKTETYKLDTSSAGKKTVTLSGSVVDADRTELPINKTVTVTVEEKKVEQKPVETPKEETPKEEPKPAEPTFRQVNETVYVQTDSVNVRGTWSASGGQYGTLKKGESVTRTGVSSEKINGYIWSRISYNGKTAYVISSALTTTKPEEKKEEEKSTNKALKELIVDNYELTPNFDPQTTKYSLTLKDSDEKLNIKATPEDEKATVDITGNGDFKVGNNIVKITVTAEDGTARIYTITVSKTNEDGVLDMLKLSKLQISNATLEPSFDPEITNYVIIVEDPSTIKTENVFATAEDENVEITVAENEQSENGEKVITIMLEDKKGSKTGVYQITVKKPVNTAVSTLKNNTDNSIYFILGGIIGILLILIIIIIIVLKKTGNKEDKEDIKNKDELSDNYDYSLKGAIDEANSEYDDEMVERSNFKSQILNSDIQNKEHDEDVDITIFDKTEYQEDDEYKPDTSTKKKGKHF